MNATGRQPQLRDGDTQLVFDTGIAIAPDYRRVIARLFIPGHEDVGPGDSRAMPVIERLLLLSDDDVASAVQDIVERFQDRHRDLIATFRRHADLVSTRIDPSIDLSADRWLLLGATFTHEYTIEGASLCNPSAVLFPVRSTPTDAHRRETDQTDAAADTVSFVMSVRCIGEGHRSSISFRTGTVSTNGHVSLDEPGPFPEMALGTPGPYKKSLFQHRLTDTAEEIENTAFALGHLPDYFNREDLDAGIEALASDSITRRHTEETILRLRQLAQSSYCVEFPEEVGLSERVLWPQVPAEQNGMEDARFVRFVDESGFVTYFGTYTAFDGVNIAQHLLETTDFRSFSSAPVDGPAANGKGLAIFPRKINGQFAALSRSDRESNSVAFSSDVYSWLESTPIQVPEQPWETVQLGNCGSPIETSAGWLVLTHGVGPMRTYCLGALLLDLDDPTQVIGQARQPILSPSPDRRNGYVPNVLYTCGAFTHGDVLVLPYAIADQSIAIATLSVNALLEMLLSSNT